MHPAGYLILPDCAIARSGLIQYKDVQDENGDMIADGSVIDVYRPPQALEECVDNFNNIPVTITHPKQNSVDPDNVKRVIVGTVGGNAHIEKRNGDAFIVADIIIHDKEAIELLQNNKDFSELSAGYETCYKNQRGRAPNGQSYEAVQFYLMPNHVAVVENGRCGSECRVCDHDNITNKGEVDMKINKVASKATDEKNVKYRYFLSSDSSDEVTEIKGCDFEELEKKGIPSEELDEDEVSIEEDIPGIESDEDEIENGNEDKKKKVEVEVGSDEEENEDEVKKPSKGIPNELEGTNDEDVMFEVELDNGVVGKMDAASYDYVKRYCDVQKKGDAAIEAMKLSAVGSRILGNSFAVDSYINDGKFDANKLKRDVIKKQMPDIVVTSLKNDAALDNMFECAVKSSQKKVDSWEKDMTALVSPIVDSNNTKGMVELARNARLKKLNK